jgi:hypothetical protein
LKIKNRIAIQTINDFELPPALVELSPVLAELPPALVELPPALAGGK